MSKPCVPAESFLGTVAANVDNKELSDADFREFVRNSLPIVIFQRPDANSISHAHADGRCYRP